MSDGGSSSHENEVHLRVIVGLGRGCRAGWKMCDGLCMSFFFSVVSTCLPFYTLLAENFVCTERRQLSDLSGLGSALVGAAACRPCRVAIAFSSEWRGDVDDVGLRYR